MQLLANHYVRKLKIALLKLVFFNGFLQILRLKTY